MQLAVERKLMEDVETSFYNLVVLKAIPFPRQNQRCLVKLGGYLMR